MLFWLIILIYYLMYYLSDIKFAFYTWKNQVYKHLNILYEEYIWFVYLISKILCMRKVVQLWRRS